MSEPIRPPRQRAAPRLAISLDTSGGANQADAAGADINALVAQYKRNGTMPIVHQANPLYGDFTFPEGLHEYREAILNAEDRFMNLPADVRTVCDNDFVNFVELFSTPGGQEKLEKAGLQIQNLPPTPVIPNNSPEATPTPTPTPTPVPDPTPTST